VRRPLGLRARSALGPCPNGQARASAVTDGCRWFRETAGHRFCSSGSWDCRRAIRIVVPKDGPAPSASKWAATDIGNDRGARPKTVEDRDCRSCQRTAIDLAFLTRFHGPQHHVVPCRNAGYRSRTEEARDAGLLRLGRLRVLTLSPGSSGPVEFTAVFGSVVDQQPAVAARRQARGNKTVGPKPQLRLRPTAGFCLSCCCDQRLFAVSQCADTVTPRSVPAPTAQTPRVAAALRHQSS
jgi:hypothetical protein